MFNGLLEFVGLIVIILVLAFFAVVRNPVQWWKEQDGKGSLASALKGIVVLVILGMVLILGISLLRPAKAESFLDTNHGRYLTSAYLYAGIDRTFKVSPQCEPKGNYADDRLTSNMGVGVNFWQHNTKPVSLHLIYHHQSCVFGSDRNSYDAIGAQLRWEFFTR